jgi:hypothetical protein
MNTTQITREQMKELDCYRDTRGNFRAEYHGAIVVHVLGQVLTTPKGIETIRAFMEGLMDAGQVLQAIDTYRIARAFVTGEEQQKRDKGQITLNIFIADSGKTVDAVIRSDEADDPLQVRPEHVIRSENQIEQLGENGDDASTTSGGQPSDSEDD